MIYVVSDNSTAGRGMIVSVFKGKVATKQDPFHVIRRFTDKVAVSARHRFAKQMKRTIYKSNGEFFLSERNEINLRRDTDTVRDCDAFVCVDLS